MTNGDKTAAPPPAGKPFATKVEDSEVKTVSVATETVMGKPLTEKADVKVDTAGAVVPPIIVNPMATPQPSQILSDEKKAQMETLAADAPVGPKVKPDAAPTSEVRVEVPPGMEHLADDKGQVAYATVIVSDKTIPAASAPEPMGSKRLEAEQAAGKAALERKHGPGQLKREQAQGAKSASRTT